MIQTLQHLQPKLKSMKKCYQKTGYLVTLEPQSFDHLYLTNLDLNNKNENILEMRGLNSLKVNPCETSAEDVLKMKQKPGPKVTNLGMLYFLLIHITHKDCIKPKYI